MRHLVENTFRAVNGDTTVSPDEILSIDSQTVEDIPGLLAHLSQPIFEINAAGKIIVDKSPGSAKSPDRYDAVMMSYCPKKRPMVVSQALTAQLMANPVPGSNAAMFGHLRF